MTNLSREEKIGSRSKEEERVQYDGADTTRLATTASDFVNSATELLTALGQYRDELERPVDEDTPSRIGYARRALVEAWAIGQGALSHIAWVVRINGDEALDRLLVEGDKAIDMSGL